MLVLVTYQKPSDKVVWGVPTSAIRHEIVPKAYYINEIPKKVIAKWDFKVVVEGARLDALVELVFMASLDFIVIFMSRQGSLGLPRVPTKNFHKPTFFNFAHFRARTMRVRTTRARARASCALFTSCQVYYIL